ncbi:hypothetical protein GCM10010344_41130 [Streptomyces bluensis]|nr:hypothetical protein GCM10010344_41130 [Streptomyces bluensis]
MLRVENRMPGDPRHSITIFKPMSAFGPSQRFGPQIMVMSWAAFGSGAGCQGCSDNRQTEGDVNRAVRARKGVD